MLKFSGGTLPIVLSLAAHCYMLKFADMLKLGGGICTKLFVTLPAHLLGRAYNARKKIEWQQISQQWDQVIKLGANSHISSVLRLPRQNTMWRHQRFGRHLDHNSKILLILSNCKRMQSPFSKRQDAGRKITQTYIILHYTGRGQVSLMRSK